MDNQTQVIASTPAPQTTAGDSPYPSSFIDRLMGFIERLPGPYWLAYLLLFLVQSALMHVLSWIDGWLPAYTVSPMLFIYPFWLWVPLAMMTYLHSVSSAALTSFSPLLDLPMEALERLRLEFIHLPTRGVVLNSLGWTAFYALLNLLAAGDLFREYGIGPLAGVPLILEGLVSFTIGATIYYHTLRQLRLVHRTVKLVKQFNLFRLDPVYAFARLTSQIGIVWIFLFSASIGFFPIEFASIPFFGLLALQLGLAVSAFVLPLWVVNRRLVAEKLRLLAELNRQTEYAIARLHELIQQNETENMQPLNHAMSALNTERSVLMSIPTWPWRAETFTGFLSALVLPLVLFLVQSVITRWFGGS